jgi:hypothetical protein
MRITVGRIYEVLPIFIVNYLQLIAKFITYETLYGNEQDQGNTSNAR